MRNLDDGSNILPTKLCPTNYEVENINRVHINGIRSAPVKYPGKDDVPSEDGPRRILLNWLEKGCIALNHVDLKIGNMYTHSPHTLRSHSLSRRGHGLDAQVMLIKNLSSELVNGSRGVVVGWADQGPSALYFHSYSTTTIHEGDGGDDTTLSVLMFFSNWLRSYFASRAHKQATR
jgi:hypothetical protein